MSLGRWIRRIAKRVMWAVLPASRRQPLRRWHYRRLVAASGPATEPELGIVREIISPGDTVIDIGANIGVYTKALSEYAGPNGVVYSVEPFPSTFDILRANAASLALDNVTLINAALTDFEGYVEMGAPMDADGAEVHTRASIGSDAGAAMVTESVPATTIDARFAAIAPAVSFVKCDVEGHELQCIRGASAFLHNSRAAWLIEVSGDPDNTGSGAHELMSIFAGYGLDPWRMDGGGLARRRPGDRSINYFFLADAHVARLRERGVAID